MAVMAKALNKPFYVVAESFKFVRMYPLNQGDLPNDEKVLHDMREYFCTYVKCYSKRMWLLVRVQYTLYGGGGTLRAGPNEDVVFSLTLEFGNANKWA